MKVAEALTAAAGLALARLDAQLLLLHALGRPLDDRGWLLAHDTDLLDAATEERFLFACSRRAAHEPVAYIVGHKEFFGLKLHVDSRVLVPRPDTETLVEWSLELLAGQAAPRVIDLGTGSGAIALAIKKHCPQARVEAVDRSEQALAVAQANADALGLDVAFARASWLEGAAGPYDLVVSNPPYVEAADPHLEALKHEPLSALAAGPDGLDDLREIIRQAPAQLAPGGWLLLEHGWNQAPAVRALLAQAGFEAVASRTDLAGIARCSGGKRPALG
jgi:release factor glutamine methyltransferase